MITSLMMRNEDLLRIEFIGLKVKIIDASDKNLVGVEGEVVDETKNTFLIRIPKGEGKYRIIQVPKKGTWFLFDYRGIRLKVYGNMIIAQPHKRLTKKYPKKWRYMY